MKYYYILLLYYFLYHNNILQVYNKIHHFSYKTNNQRYNYLSKLNIFDQYQISHIHYKIGNITGSGSCIYISLIALFCNHREKSAVVKMPVFRPLIGFDKSEIIDIARKIGTLEISEQPFEDCCTVFTPRHPATHPKMDKILEGEKHLDEEELIRHALEGTEIIRV